MNIKNYPSDPQILIELGSRLARHRLNQNMTQGQLAHEAGVSKRTVVRLENGESTQLTHFIRILRTLDLLKNIDALIPAPLISPVEALKAAKKERRRASTAGKKPRMGLWTWGEDKKSKGGES